MTTQECLPKSIMMKNFINKRLREKNEARAYTNNIGETMLEYEYLENK